ncbi:MAG: His-Xaa-Ser system radical SAM maturase HxsC [Chloroflexi bacterium]|nr:His-Xaa-Ser system radical SAM maturase HxsC [Chloroflexota bacterium]
MKNFTFKLDYIHNATLGRVDALPVGSRNCYTFIGNQVDKVINGKNNDGLEFYNVPSIELPSETNDGSIFKPNIGDVVLFNPSGVCSIEYESVSHSNCILLTERCNSKCIMCVQPPKPCSDSLNLAFALVELINNEPQCIGITGGEPTLVWDGLLELLNRCKEKFPSADIQLLSNARLLKNYTRSKALSEAGGDRLIVCVPIYSDIDQIHDKIVGVDGAFWEAVNGIYNLERLSVSVEIRTVVQLMNYKRLPQWSEFIYRFFPFVKHIAIMALEPIGLSLNNLGDVWIDPVDYIKMLEHSIKFLNRGDMEVSIFNQQLCTLPRNLWKFSKKSISEWKNIFFEECERCVEKSNCAGFFSASKNQRSRGIKTIVPLEEEL